MKHFFGGGRGHGSGPPYEIAPEERGRHSPSTPLVMKVTSIVYNPPFQKFLDPPMIGKDIHNPQLAKLLGKMFRSRLPD